MLTQLAVRRVRDVRWLWLLMLPLWTPLAIVVTQGVFGFDVYRWFVQVGLSPMLPSGSRSLR